jgi:hypothetical protein
MTKAAYTCVLRFARIWVASCLGIRRSAHGIARVTASRFTPDGKLLNGPALGPLDKAPLTWPNKLRRGKQQGGSKRHRSDR